VRQIQKRGRPYESSIRLDYLQNLNDRYSQWIKGYDKGKLLVIEVDQIEFDSKKEDLGKVIEKIDAELNGLF
jgi:deoxyadenosine/deoxycytidine kinase